MVGKNGKYIVLQCPRLLHLLSMAIEVVCWTEGKVGYSFSSALGKQVFIFQDSKCCLVCEAFMSFLDAVDLTTLSLMYPLLVL